MDDEVSIGIEESQIKEKSEISQFTNLVNEYTDKNPRSNWGTRFKYYPGSASAFYEKTFWSDALSSLDDPLGFFDAIGASLPQELTPDAISGLIADFNGKYNNKGIFFREVNPNDEITITVNGVDREVANLLSQSDDYGIHTDGAREIVDYEGDFTNPTKVICEAEVPDDSKSIVLINKGLENQNPLRAIVALAHEVGHAIEHRFSAKSESGTVPSTERTSALWGVKMAKLLYQKYQDPKAVKYASGQAQLYDRVVLGK